ncbi:MAG: aminomethyl-transferring glycine dehydrogenase [Vicinamibacterales bacterium]
MSDTFESRHIGPRAHDLSHMLQAVGAPSIDALIDQIIPADIRLSSPLALPPAEAEAGYLSRLRGIAARNSVCRSYIGMGYYDTITPAVIVRNVLENPGWYTPYTPYQAEIAQGRLESLLNFQTMVTELTGMEIANASLLDEATAAAEAMTLLARVTKRQHALTFVVSERVFPQVKAVLVTRAAPLGITLRFLDFSSDDVAAALSDDVFGLYVQSPDDHGEVHDLRGLISQAHDKGVLVAVGTDLLASAMFTPAGAMGADVVIGSAQRLGVPLGYGGPHAAFFATREAYVRQAPGRIIGVSVDSKGRRAYRMALQTREQHIRREKATSNICTAQALLANISAFYAVYHGPAGLRDIAGRAHGYASRLAVAATGLGWTQTNAAYFDTVRFAGDEARVGRVRAEAEARKINFRYPSKGIVQVSFDETVTDADLADVIRAFEAASEMKATVPVNTVPASEALARTSEFMTHPVFNTHASETQMMRYIRRLEKKDIGLDTAMIPLGSCTMKLNAAAEMMPITWPEFSRIHPFAPVEQAAGYRQIIDELSDALCIVTGFAAVSLQPNSGAQGEFAGLLVINAYHQSRGEAHRNVVLIPQSAHGTNPASAAMVGLKVVVVATDEQGNVRVDDLRAKAEGHRENLSCLMVTYPSTHGVFEGAIREMCAIIHEYGGQVYMDGANMNAQVGLTSPAAIGADVCHLNLHKTFAIPHGGGGPGMGPIGVAAHLVPFLPGHAVVSTGGPQAVSAVSAAPWGSASILLISYGYIRMLGAEGVTAATKYAMLNANYLKARLEGHYPVLYSGANGRVAHELIFDLRPFKARGVDETDVAKRLMDYGFHAPTVSFPVAGTLMVEPTESEPLEELDRFCDAMIAIWSEIQAVIDGTADKIDNPLKNAPHTAQDVAADEWTHKYTREQAAYPVPSLRHNKFWPSISRIDNSYGDRNLMCACPPMEDYEEK